MGHLDFSRRRHSHGTLQDQRWFVDLSREQHFPHRARAAFLRLHVRLRGKLSRPCHSHPRHAVHSYPDRKVTLILALLIYANFFTHHFVPDIRILLFVLVAAAFGRTWVYYRPYRKFRRMPLLLGFCLVTLFIWAAENIGTFGAIWVYPHQRHGWQLVHFGKYGAWFLLMIISFVLVSLVHPPRLPEAVELK